MKKNASLLRFLALALTLSVIGACGGGGGGNNGGGGGNNPPPKQPLTLSFGAPTFSPTTSAAGDSQSIAVGDIDGDGVMDVAVANQGVSTNKQVSVFLGKGDGTFKPTLDFDGVDDPHSLALGDFNADKKLDIAVNNNTQVAVLLNNGTATLFGAPSAPLATGGAGSRDMTVADVDGKNGPDLITSNEISNDITVVFNDGAGNFPPGNVKPFNGGNKLFGPRGVTAADFNGGGIDIALANFTADGGGKFNASVLTNDGTGAFNTGTNYPTSSTNANYGIAAGDFNGDAKPDLVVANPDDHVAKVLLNDGSGNFSASVDYSTGFDCASVAVADFDLDGKMDFVTANFAGQGGGGPGDLTVLLGKGDGTFQDKKSLPAAGNQAQLNGPRSVAVGDLNGDGKPDLVFLDNMNKSVGVMLNTSK